MEWKFFEREIKWLLGSEANIHVEYQQYAEEIITIKDRTLDAIKLYCESTIFRGGFDLYPAWQRINYYLKFEPKLQSDFKQVEPYFIKMLPNWCIIAGDYALNLYYRQNRDVMVVNIFIISYTNEREKKIRRIMDEFKMLYVISKYEFTSIANLLHQFDISCWRVAIIPNRTLNVEFVFTCDFYFSIFTKSIGTFSNIDTEYLLRLRYMSWCKYDIEDLFKINISRLLRPIEDYRMYYNITAKKRPLNVPWQRKFLYIFGIKNELLTLVTCIKAKKIYTPA